MSFLNNLFGVIKEAREAKEAKGEKRSYKEELIEYLEENLNYKIQTDGLKILDKKFSSKEEAIKEAYYKYVGPHSSYAVMPDCEYEYKNSRWFLVNPTSFHVLEALQNIKVNPGNAGPGECIKDYITNELERQRLHLKVSKETIKGLKEKYDDGKSPLFYSENSQRLLSLIGADALNKRRIGIVLNNSVESLYDISIDDNHATIFVTDNALQNSNPFIEKPIDSSKSKTHLNGVMYNNYIYSFKSVEDIVKNSEDIDTFIVDSLEAYNELVKVCVDVYILGEALDNESRDKVNKEKIVNDIIAFFDIFNVDYERTCKQINNNITTNSNELSEMKMFD